MLADNRPDQATAVLDVPNPERKRVVIGGGGFSRDCRSEPCNSVARGVSAQARSKQQQARHRRADLQTPNKPELIRRASVWRSTTPKTNRRLHEDPRSQARDCTRDCWSPRSGCHGPIVCCTDQWHVDQGGGTGCDDQRAILGVSGLSLRFVSHPLLLRISRLLLLRISRLFDLCTVLEISAVLRLRRVVTPSSGSGGFLRAAAGPHFSHSTMPAPV